MVEDGESENRTRDYPTVEENGWQKREGSEGRGVQDATVSEYEEKRWKEDVREKAEVKTIGQWVLEAGIDSLENEYPFRMLKKDIFGSSKFLVKK